MKQKLINLLKWLLVKLEGPNAHPLFETVGQLKEQIQDLNAQITFRDSALEQRRQRLDDQNQEYKRLQSEFAQERKEYKAKLVELDAQRTKQVDILYAAFQEQLESQSINYHLLEKMLTKERAEYKSQILELEVKFSKPFEPPWYKRFFAEPPPTETPDEVARKAMIARLSSIGSNGRRF